MGFSVLLVFVPSFLACYIACTRITDYWHHVGDVAVGSLIGIAGASISFVVYREKLNPFNLAEHKQTLLAAIDHNDDQQQSIKLEKSEIVQQLQSDEDNNRIQVVKSVNSNDPMNIQVSVQ